MRATGLPQLHPSAQKALLTLALLSFCLFFFLKQGKSINDYHSALISNSVYVLLIQAFSPLLQQDGKI